MAIQSAGTLRNRTSGSEMTVDAAALFIMIGTAPNTAWPEGQVALDDHGLILTGRDAGDHLDGFAMSLPGVFAVGDIRSDSVKGVASAVGEGSVVVWASHQHRNREASRRPQGIGVPVSPAP